MESLNLRVTNVSTHIRWTQQNCSFMLNPTSMQYEFARHHFNFVLGYTELVRRLEQTMGNSMPRTLLAGSLPIWPRFDGLAKNT
jgi:hypothetical protein